MTGLVQSKDLGKSDADPLCDKASYPLTPIQGGMLYQQMLDGEGAGRRGFDIEQIWLRLSQKIDPVHFQAAVHDVVSAFPVLLNTFRWKGLARPEQSAQAPMKIPFQALDWRQGDVDRLRAEFLAADRRQGMDLSAGPLTRVALAQTGADQSELIWTCHHIVVDGSTMSMMLERAFAGYRARLRGERMAFEGQSLPFQNYVQWQAAQDSSAAIAYFRELLSGREAATPLPLASARARSDDGPVDYGRAAIEIDAVLRAALTDLVKAHGSSLGCVVQNAWALALSRLTGERDVVFGVTRTTRYAMPGGASMAGPLINTLPMRVQVEDAQTVGGFLQSLRAQWLAQRPHVAASLAEVSAATRHPPGTPLFQSLLLFDDADLADGLRKVEGFANVECELLEKPTPPLTLQATGGAQLRLRLLFDTAQYDEATAARLLGYVVHALRGLTQAATVGDIDILAPEERRRIVYEWNDTDRPFSDGVLIHQLFERQALNTPEAVAVESGGRQFSFGAIDAQANQLANALIARGAGPGQFVALCLPRTEQLVIALLGIAKSGAAYVPLDASYPADRLAFMVEDTAARLVVVDGAAPALACEALDIHSPEVRAASTARPAARAQPGDVCYTIYTSGSTGKPKGVVMTHCAVVNTLEWVSRTMKVAAGDRVLFVNSPNFDLSVYDIFGVLGAGGAVVVASSADLAEPRDLLSRLLQDRITIWNSAPAMLQRLSLLFPPQGGNHLRLVMLSGDWIPLTLPDLVRQSFPRAEVVSLGGATEAAIWSNWHPVGQIQPQWTSIPYGTPIQNSQYYVLDAGRRPLPVGVTGDLYISGVCLAQGYLNRPELTAERFVPNPFRPGERMYMTGDLARYFPDGVIEFLGRSDNQVKIRGYRVEMGEVEAALLALPAITAAVCTAFTDVSGAKALAAYVAANDPAAVSADSLRSQLAQTLPEFMLPSRLIVMAALPVTGNGKVDRKALPSPLAQTSGTRQAALSTPEEQRVAQTWKQLLGCESIGPDDNFFELGGDSILAVSVVLELERAFGRSVPLSWILQHPTVAKLAAAIAQGQQREGHIVSLNARGEGPAMVLFTGIGGFGLFFHDLATRLGTPVHIVNAIGADDPEENTDLNMEQMCDIYEAEILKACPQGPLLIGGYSYGALLAYEIAARLERSGRTILGLVSFDGPAPGHPYLLPLPLRILDHLRHQARMAVRLDFAGLANYVSERWLNVRVRFEGMENDARLAPQGVDASIQARLQKVAVSLHKARRHYAPDYRIHAPLHLLRTEVPLSQIGNTTNQYYGWDEYAGRLPEVMLLPGSHLDFFSESNNAALAQTLRTLLEKGKA